LFFFFFFFLASNAMGIIYFQRASIYRLNLGNSMAWRSSLGCTSS
jgi:hypothetical protein